MTIWKKGRYNDERKMMFGTGKQLFMGEEHYVEGKGVIRAMVIESRIKIKEEDNSRVEI